MIVPATWVAMLIWAFVRVPPSQGLLNQHTTLKGSELGWAWLSAVNSALGLYSTLAVNIPDFTVCMNSIKRVLPQLIQCDNEAICQERTSVIYLHGNSTVCTDERSYLVGNVCKYS